MLCYKDRTYCKYYTECAVPCSRALTPEVLKAADEWWGSPDGAPICEFAEEPDCMTKYVTIWERLDEKSGEYKHNHIEDGWSIYDNPESKSKEQKMFWKKATWKRTYGFINGNKIIREASIDEIEKGN